MCSGTSSPGSATRPSGNSGKSFITCTAAPSLCPIHRLPAMASGDFAIVARGPFTLASAARFITGWPPANRVAGESEEVRLEFLCDDFSGDARVLLRQADDGTVHATIGGGS